MSSLNLDRSIVNVLIPGRIVATNKNKVAAATADSSSRQGNVTNKTTNNNCPGDHSTSIFSSQHSTIKVTNDGNDTKSYGTKRKRRWDVGSEDIVIDSNSSVSSNVSISVKRSESKDYSLYSLHGTHIIQSILEVLQVTNTSCYITACVLFHRYFYHISCDRVTEDTTNMIPMNQRKFHLHDNNVWIIALACILLSIKMDEFHQQRITVRQLIIAFVHIYRKQAFLINCDDDGDSEVVTLNIIKNHPKVEYSTLIESMKYNDDRRQLLKSTFPSISVTGPVFEMIHSHCIEMENRILRRFGFIIYWIPKQHCHVFIKSFVDRIFNNELSSCLNSNDNQQTLKSKDDCDTSDWKEQLLQLSWDYCTISYRLNLCIQYRPQIIACSAVHLACLDMNQLLPVINVCSSNNISTKTVPADLLSWWDILCGIGYQDDISQCSNTILSIADKHNEEAIVATKAFLKSPYVSHLADMDASTSSSFNDPGSFLWDYFIENNH